MERCVRFFAKPCKELDCINDKLYADPTALMNANEIWVELFTFLLKKSDVVIWFDVADLIEEEATRTIHIVKFLIQDDLIFLDDDERQGVDAELMTTVVCENLLDFFTDEEMEQQLIFETSEQTLKNFNVI
jgi:hypothetical protein